jgi:chitinase
VSNRTKDRDTDSGTCYTDGKNAGLGCGVFVEGVDCEMTGDEMAAYENFSLPFPYQVSLKKKR